MGRFGKRSDVVHHRFGILKCFSPFLVGDYLMKVLVHGFSSHRGGVESFLIAYCSRMMDVHRDLSFDFILYGDDRPDYLNELASYDVKFFNVVSRMQNPYKNVHQLKRVVSEGNYDLVWFNACSLSDVTLLNMANRQGIPCVVHSHNSAPMGNKLNAILHGLHKRSISNKATFGIACSDYAAKFLFPDRFLASDSCKVISNAVDCDRFRFNPSDRLALRRDFGVEDGLLIGHVGRFAEQKNHAFLIDVMREIANMDNHSKLLLLGSGSLEAQIKDRVDALELSDRIIFAGAVSDSHRYYSAMDCFVLPSLYEGMPLALLEAQANGLPCVVSDVVSPMSFVSDSVRAVSLNEPPASWAHAILKTANEPIDRQYGAQVVDESGYGLPDSAESVYSVLSHATRYRK